MAAVALMTSASVSAQWLTRPTAGIPRAPDGKPNLAAPVPRTADGKPELAGLWKPSPGLTGDIAKNLKPGDVPFQPEAVHSYRQIFTDGRELPPEPNPTWFGYSVGHWEGDTLVVHTTGFNDKGWLDNAGKPATDQLRVTERFTRKDFGNMDIQITIDDAKAYTKPWTVTQPLAFQADTELLEYICNENNRYFDLVHDVKR